MGVSAKKIFQFYKDGFAGMTLGKYLWAIVLIKLFIMFAVLKLFFFKSELSRFDTTTEKGDYVKEQLIEKLHPQE